MAARLTLPERRQAPRVPPEACGWPSQAVLRPGQQVDLVNVSAGGALVRSGARVKPGMPTELQLQGASKRSVRGRVGRACVFSLTPLCYEAALVFDSPLGDAMGSG